MSRGIEARSPAPQVVEQELRHTYHVRPIGDAVPVEETLYAISPERVIRRAAVRKITEAARQRMSGRPIASHSRRKFESPLAHAATVCEAWQRSRLERLCRYIARPPRIRR